MDNKIKQGFHRITNEEYHGHKSSLSHSGLIKILKTPAHYQAYLNGEKKQTPAMAFGSAFHTAVLEPSVFESEYIVAPNVDKRTKAGKVQWEEFKEMANGKKLIDESDREKLMRMNDAVLAHPEAAKILSSGIAELSGFWENVRGFMCKIRPDWLPGNGVIVDLKSCDDASEYAFSRACSNFGYHIQSAFYLDGATEITGQIHDTFVFIAVEKEPPYAVAVYYASNDMVAAGREGVEKALNIYHECITKNEWPGYPSEAKELNLPYWHKGE